MAVCYTIIKVIVLQIVCFVVVVLVLILCFYLGACKVLFITELSNFIKICLGLYLFLSILPGTQWTHSIWSLFQFANFFQLRKNFFLLLISPSKIFITCILGLLDLSSKPFNITFKSSHSNSWYFLSFEVMILLEMSSKNSRDMFKLPPSQNRFKWDEMLFYHTSRK